ncbi:MAG: 2'-5' RNA ligase family protein [Rudaea sp.]|uniref:2'-5' RNA ligase family protein n=1 Tax=unclassified Rudaea TaxID=2627037 RepID=UPI0010FA29CE|nr:MULTISPECIES: 2'-5' RNA ligase family protein [unclassified Rudaea]MBN8887865.1 2'-5' RNA ligase family protein [Rudaea sp.]MBR0347427.1 2'-5' RNA ligase family protein [Rudaea sp.]
MSVASAFPHSESIFFGIHVPIEVQHTIRTAAAELAKVHRMPGRIFDGRHFHITLCEIGRFHRLREPWPAALLRSAQTVKIEPFFVTLDRATGYANGSRGFPNVLLPDEESTRALRTLHESLRIGQEFNGLRAPKQYAPHLTVSRSSEAWAAQVSVAPIRWRVTEFELIHSHHDGERRHEQMECFPLAGV